MSVRAFAANCKILTVLTAYSLLEMDTVIPRGEWMTAKRSRNGNPEGTLHGIRDNPLNLGESVIYLHCESVRDSHSCIKKLF